jgi:hypothetical protein
MLETVSDALVRYINQGITLGSVNLPEVQLRSLTLDEPNHARVGTLHVLVVSGELTQWQDYLHSSQRPWCTSKRFVRDFTLANRWWVTLLDLRLTNL